MIVDIRRHNRDINRITTKLVFVIAVVSSGIGVTRIQAILVTNAMF